MFAVYSTLTLLGNEEYRNAALKEYHNLLIVNWIGIHTQKGCIHTSSHCTMSGICSLKTINNHLGFSLKLLIFSGRFTSHCFTKNRQQMLQMLLQTNVYLIRSLVFKCKLQSLRHLQVLTTFVQLGIIWTHIQQFKTV